MGPRSHERGNEGKDDEAGVELTASMGPRSHERGNHEHLYILVPVRQASMGPRSHERGNLIFPTLTDGILPLQWGRVLMNAETRWHYPGRCKMARFNGAAFS